MISSLNPVSSARNAVRNLLLRHGWEIRRVDERRDRQIRQQQAELERWRFLKAFSPSTVLDIGANTGQFASLVRKLLPEARILSFEPISDCIRELQKVQHTLSPLEIFPYALGKEDGSAVINRNQFSPSSSLLDMQTLHCEELPHTKETTKEPIQVCRLDSLRESLRLTGAYFIKVDVQGYTEPVLRGGELTVRGAQAIVAEVSLRPLYRGEATFDELWSILTDWGFVYRGNVDQWASKRDGRILQADCLFENRTCLGGG